MYNLSSHAPIELINIIPFNPLISKCQIKVCWVGDTPNRNRSIITKEVATEMANSLPGSPIVGYYNETTGDFEEHNKLIEISGGKITLKPTTKPYGFVDLSAKVWFQWFEDYDGIMREYLVTEGWLWTGQYPECQRVITQGNNHSMELSEDERYLDGNWTKDIKGNKEFFIINEAIISKLCILGEKFEPCFQGGSVTAPKIEFSFEDSFKEQLFSMMTEIKNILNEGGANMVTDNITPVVEEPVVETPEVVEEPVEETPIVEEVAVPAEEPAEPELVIEADPIEEPEEPEAADDTQSNEENCEKCGKLISECECKEYILEDIPEYVELQTKYSELETRFSELENAHEVLKSETETLVKFKASVDKKEKETLINSFYMLSDELKKDVVEKIDEYSLEEIEAKLSILCVRNKVSFDLEENTKTDPVSYNLMNENLEENLPEWIRAIQNRIAEN